MKQASLLLVFLFVAFSCQKNEVPADLKTRLKGYRIVYSEPEKTEVYRGIYTYNSDNRLVAEVQNDTTYLIGSNQIVPVKTTVDYEYDAEGFLIKQVKEALSIRLTAKVETKYEYNAGRLSLEDFGSRVREYRYNSDGSLKETIFTSLNSGSKSIVEYDDDIPLALDKINDGYIFMQGSETTYLDSDLLVKRYERYKDGALVFEQDYQQQKLGIPQSALPNFKGWPKIKSFHYRKGIENKITTYKHIEGQKKLSDEKVLVSTFDNSGFLMKNQGYENINQETDSPLRRDLLFEYEYETY